MSIARSLRFGAAAVLALVLIAVVVVALRPATLLAAGDNTQHRDHHENKVTIPTEDRFVPYAMTIHVGESVVWQNTDTDDHTVVSDDAFTTSDNKGTNHVIPGTDSNSAHNPGTFTLRFKKPGLFVYFCRFHSHLDSYNQPIAPGPKGGIQDPSTNNYGTPMTGVIAVLP